MSLNNSILSYNKIKEIEECNPISPPSISSEDFEQNEIFFYSFYLPSKYILEQNDIQYINRSFSSSSLLIFSNIKKNIKLGIVHLFSNEKNISDRDYKNNNILIKQNIKGKLNNQMKSINDNIIDKKCKKNIKNIYFKNIENKKGELLFSLNDYNKDNNEKNKVDNKVNEIINNQNINSNNIFRNNINNNIYRKKDNIRNNNKEIYFNKIIGKKNNFIYQQKKITKNNKINNKKAMKKIEAILNDDIKNDNSIRSKSNSRINQNESKITVKSIEKNINNRVEFDYKNQNIHIYINNNIFNFKLNNNKNNGPIKKDKNNINFENYTNFSNEKVTPSSTLIKIANDKKIKINNNNKNYFNEKNNVGTKIRNIQNINNKNEKSKPIKIQIQIPINNNKNFQNIDNNTLYSESNQNINDIKDSISNNIHSIKRNNNINHSKLKISQLKKILFQNKSQNRNGLFNIISFLDQKDIINLIETRNKKMRILINKSIYDTFYFKIKKNIKKYQEFLEVLKYSLVYSKVKGLLRIDLMLTIRFNDKNKQIALNTPFHFKLIYLYEYLKKIRKDDTNKLYDCYGFDLFLGNKKDNEKDNNLEVQTNEFKGIYFSKQITNFGYDKNDELLNIQPILPFKINDKGIFNIEIYSCKNYFINPNSIKIKLKIINLNKNIKELRMKKLENIRINEYENICKHWIKENDINNNKIVFIKKIIKKWFEPYFKIKEIFFDNVGLSVYKFQLVSEQIGTLVNNNLNIAIIIKDYDDYVENEVKKNNLLFERKNTFEIRKGENIIFYLTMKELKL